MRMGYQAVALFALVDEPLLTVFACNDWLDLYAKFGVGVWALMND